MQHVDGLRLLVVEQRWKAGSKLLKGERLRPFAERFVKCVEELGGAVAARCRFG